MKTKPGTSKILLLSIILTVCIGAGLPNRVPISQMEILDMVARKGPFSVSTSLQITNVTGGLDTCGMTAKDIKFDSYGSYLRYTWSNVQILLNLIRTQGSTNHVRLKTKMTYHSVNPDKTISVKQVFYKDKSLGPASSIPRWFYEDITLTETPTVSINGVSISSANIKMPDGTEIPLGISGTSDLLWDKYLLTNNTDGLRLIVTSTDGETAIYNQDGSLITRPTISIVWIPGIPPEPTISNPDNEEEWSIWNKWYNLMEMYSFYWWNGLGYPENNRYNVFINSMHNVNTTLEMSTNSLDWTPVMTITSDYWANSAVWVIQPDQPMGLFRARSY